MRKTCRVSTHSRPKAAGERHEHHCPHRRRFNTQPPEGGWTSSNLPSASSLKFQHTAARRRLGHTATADLCSGLFQHTAARRRLVMIWLRIGLLRRFQHTAARRRLDAGQHSRLAYAQFQHTAARRRLVHHLKTLFMTDTVSTHSRPKAAGFLNRVYARCLLGFNTQPPEGGWKLRPRFRGAI